MGEEKRSPASTLFVRKASGLVREMSTGAAFAYNLVGSSATAGGIQLLLLTSVPMFLMAIGPWLVPGYAIGFLIFSVFLLALIFLYLCLVSVMPRTGGDYVFSTRITSPFVGWLEGWSLLWTVLGAIGTSVPIVGWVLSGTLDIGAVVMGFSSWVPMIEWWSSNTGIMTLGVIVAILVLLQNLLPARSYFNSFKWLVLVSYVLFAFAIPLFVGATPAKFEAAFESYSGMTTKQLADTAVANGLVYPPFSIGSLSVFASVALWAFLGFQFSIYFAGELKGDVRRNTVISTLGGWTGQLFFNVPFIIILVALLGWGGVLTNWGYLFWVGKAPLNGVIPFVPLLGAMVTPNLAILGIISGIGQVMLGILFLSSWAAIVSRIVFAWAMDRVIPSWFAAVNRRTRSPIRLAFLACVAIVCFTAVDILGANPALTIWFTVLMGAMTWIMPGVNGILLPFRRKDLFELAPSWARKKIFGMWLIVFVGVIWLLFICYTYVVSFISPFVSAVTAGGLGVFAGYAMSTGIGAFVVVMIVGTVVWYVSRWYNARKGIRFQDIFSQLPPE